MAWSRKAEVIGKFFNGVGLSIACVILILQRCRHQVTGQLHKTEMDLFSSDIVSNGFRLYLYIAENLPRVCRLSIHPFTSSL